MLKIKFQKKKSCIINLDILWLESTLDLLLEQLKLNSSFMSTSTFCWFFVIMTWNLTAVAVTAVLIFVWLWLTCWPEQERKKSKQRRLMTTNTQPNRIIPQQEIDLWIWFVGFKWSYCSAISYLVMFHNVQWWKITILANNTNQITQRLSRKLLLDGLLEIYRSMFWLPRLSGAWWPIGHPLQSKTKQWKWLGMRDFSG